MKAEREREILNDNRNFRNFSESSASDKRNNVK